MKKNLTEIVFILDRSGSMAGLEDDTIGGFNAMIEKQRKESGEALVSEARRSGDRELARACDVLTQYLQGRRAIPADEGVAEAARDLIAPIKEFVALDAGARMEAAEAFCDDIARRIGALEAKLDEARE
jgi:hypothetical protein